MSRLKGYLCGVPQQECIGVFRTMGKRTFKIHSLREEAFKCFCKAMERKGYKRIGQKEFRKDGFPIFIISRIGKFGCELRAGKHMETKGKRLNRPFHQDGIYECLPE